MSSIILSHFQTRSLPAQREAGRERVEISLDLGLTTLEARILPEGVRFPTGELLTWQGIEEINDAENNCFLLQEDGIEKVALFSEWTNRLYTLMPTSGAPTMLISGIPMHRIKGTEPYRDTQEKIKAVQPVVGRVLDTATGLGYTAIGAARAGGEVVTVELDPAVLEIARVNPWSEELFDNPAITQHLGDSFDVVEGFEDGSFARILHDPPTFKLAGHLYGGAFYAELYRVLQQGGRLFHYVGDPESRTGHSTTRGVVRRLQEAGFSRVMGRPKAFGVLAYK
jgi:hypothetical protein